MRSSLWVIVTQCRKFSGAIYTLTYWYENNFRQTGKAFSTSPVGVWQAIMNTKPDSQQPEVQIVNVQLAINTEWINTRCKLEVETDASVCVRTCIEQIQHLLHVPVLYYRLSNGADIVFSVFRLLLLLTHSTLTGYIYKPLHNMLKVLIGKTEMTQFRQQPGFIYTTQRWRERDRLCSWENSAYITTCG